jgi:type VI secretion system protein ImpH
MLNKSFDNISSFVQLMRQIKNRLPESDVRFLQNTSLQFPQQEFSAVEHDDSEQQVTVLTNFLGLLGATGTLPVHYTEDVLHQLKAKNYAQKDFYDIFHQRIMELFYAANQALAPIIDADTVNLKQNEQSAIQRYLCYLLGIDYQTDNAALQHNVFYANPTPSAAKLEQILQANTLFDINVRQNRPVTESIPALYCNYLDHTRPQNMVLNETFVLGTRARFDHVYFSIMVIAKDFAEFVRLKRDTKIIETIKQHAHAYAGNAFKFNIDIDLAKQLQQPMYLSSQAYLGASSFL